MKKILVAGGAGYVGTRFCNEYCNIYDITVVDLFWFGDQLNNKIKKIKGSNPTCPPGYVKK